MLAGRVPFHLIQSLLNFRLAAPEHGSGLCPGGSAIRGVADDRSSRLECRSRHEHWRTGRMGPRRAGAHDRAGSRSNRRAVDGTKAGRHQPVPLGNRSRGLVPRKMGTPRRGWPAPAPCRWGLVVRFGRHPARHSLGPAASLPGRNACLHARGPRPRDRADRAGQARRQRALFHPPISVPRGHAHRGVHLHAADAGLSVAYIFNQR